jgi:hypothetical protein
MPMRLPTRIRTTILSPLLVREKIIDFFDGAFNYIIVEKKRDYFLQEDCFTRIREYFGKSEKIVSASFQQPLELYNNFIYFDRFYSTFDF